MLTFSEIYEFMRVFFLLYWLDLNISTPFKLPFFSMGCIPNELKDSRLPAKKSSLGLRFGLYALVGENIEEFSFILGASNFYSKLMSSLLRPDFSKSFLADCSLE